MDNTKFEFSSQDTEELKQIFIKCEAPEYDSKDEEILSKAQNQFDDSENTSHILKIPVIKLSRVLWCGQCRKEFKTSQTLKEHIKTHIKTEVFSCQNCNENFQTYSELQIHTKTHLKIKFFECDICKKQFPSKYSKRLHIIIHKTPEGLYKCPDCDKCYSKPYNYKIHARIHSRSEYFQCEFCEKRYVKKNEYDLHLLSHGNSSFNCDVCSRSFSHLSHLKKHKLRHLNQKPHECKYCPKKYCWKGDLLQHLSSHNDQYFECDICKKIFVRRDTIESHIKNHMNEASQYKCSVCMKSFTTPSDLKDHKLVHLPETKFKCEICCTTFANIRNLKLHYNVHNNKKPFECNICHKKFKYKNNIKAHKISHMGNNAANYRLSYKINGNGLVNNQLICFERMYQDRSNVNVEVTEQKTSCLRIKSETENFPSIFTKKEFVDIIEFEDIKPVPENK